MSTYKPKKKRPYYTEHQVLVHKVRYMADHDWSLEEIVCELHMNFEQVRILIRRGLISKGRALQGLSLFNLKISPGGIFGKTFAKIT